MTISLDEWYRRKWPPSEEENVGQFDQSSDGEGTFILFGKLPKEIRLMIWNEALPGPRIVFLELDFPETQPYWRRVWSNRAIDETEDIITEEGDDILDEKDIYINELGEEVGFPINHAAAFKSKTPAPALLFVCLESFEVASKMYFLAFGSSEGRPEVWFNFEKDILLLDWGFAAGPGIQYGPEEFLEELRQIKNLAVVHADSFPENFEFEDHEEWLGAILLSFTGTKRLYIVDWGNNHPPEDKSRLIFMPSNDFDAILAFFALSYYSDNKSPASLWAAKTEFSKKQYEHYQRHRVDNEWVQNALDDYFDIGDDDINNLVGNSTASSRIIPEILNNTAITPSKFVELEQARVNFETWLRNSDMKNSIVLPVILGEMDQIIVQFRN
jgi:hypothetical protein